MKEKDSGKKITEDKVKKLRELKEKQVISNNVITKKNAGNTGHKR